MTGKPKCAVGWESGPNASKCVPSTAGTSTLAGKAAGAGVKAPDGFWNYAGSVAADKVKCPGGYYCKGGVKTICPKGFFCAQGVSVGTNAVTAGHVANKTGLAFK